MAEVSDIVLARTAIGKEDTKVLFISRFKHLTGKNEKGEIRIIAVTPHRLYSITTSKTPKVDFSFHILEVCSLEGAKPMAPTLNDTFLFQLAVSIQVGEKQVPHRFVFEKEEYVGTLISFIIALLQTTFINAKVDKQVTWKLSSQEKYNAVEENINIISNALLGEGQACGGFSLSYLCICDYYKQTSEHNAEVCWDIDKIYASHACKDFKLDDFDLLDAKDLVPLIATLAYNTWFTRLDLSSLKLSNELVDVIVKVIRRTLSIEEIVLQECNMNKDQLQKITLSLATNPNKVIKRLDFSKNHLEDKGVSVLCGMFGTMQNGLEMINLSDVGMTTKGATSVVSCLKQNKLMHTTLTGLNLSGNALKLEGVQSLCDFFSHPNVLTELSLANTECPVDLLFTALHRGCQLSLEHLDISGNLFYGKKSAKDSSVSNSLSSLQQFFSMSRALKNINLSSTKIPSSAVKAVLVGLLNNPVLNDVTLDLSNNELKTQGAEELTSCLKEITLGRLDLSNNGLEQDLIPLCEALQNNHSIKELDLSRNVNKAKNIKAIADAIGDILEAETPLEKLCVADNKLRVHAGLLFDAVGTNDTLVSLDIRGNTIGDEGARMLAKALQINTKLQEILLDKNNITAKGLQGIALAMDRNYSLRSLPLPVVDLSIAMKGNTSPAFLKSYRVIEKAMIRNQSSKQSTPEQAYKVHQGLLMSSIDHYTQHTDEYVIQLKDTISRTKLSTHKKVQDEIKTARMLIKEAVLFRQVLLELYSDPEHSKNLLDDMFNKVTDDVVNSIECVVKDNIDKMLKSAINICPTALNKEVDLKEIKEDLLKSNPLFKDSDVADSIMQLGKSEIAYKLCESNLLTATNIAEHLQKLFISVLQNSNNRLNTLYDNPPEDSASATQPTNAKVNGQLEDIDIPVNEDDTLTPPVISTPTIKLLNDIVNENTFDFAWDMPRTSRSLDRNNALLSVTSEGSDDTETSSIQRHRLNTDSVYQRKKKRKTCSLKRRPTFYKETNEMQEVEIDVDSPAEKRSSVVDSPAEKRSSVVESLPSSDETLRAAVPVEDTHLDHAPEARSASFNEHKTTMERTVSVESDHTQRTSSFASNISGLTQRTSSFASNISSSIDDDADGGEDEDSIYSLNRMPSIGAFDDVSKQSVQLSVNKKRVKPMQGRRAPTKVSKLAHMKADSGDPGNDDAVKKPRPKSDTPIGNPLFDEMTTRPRVGTERLLKREPPARPSPPTPSTSKPETPARPDPPVKQESKVEAPLRPERPKKPELDKKSEPVKEKKVKPPAGAFQLPSLPNIGGMLKKRPAPKAPDSVDTADSENKGKESGVNLPAVADGDSSSTHADTPPTKPPPPSLVKRSPSPAMHDTSQHPAEGLKSPEQTTSAEPTKPSPIKKPPRGVPMGGLGGSALMAEMNKKLHKSPKVDDEEHSTIKSTPPKPQKPTPPQPHIKPTPPQRPPSLKRTPTSTEGRPNIPDRPKAMQKTTKSLDIDNASADKNGVVEKSPESSVQPSEGGQANGDSETTNGGEMQDPVTAFV